MAILSDVWAGAEMEGGLTMREILFRGQTRRKGEKVWMDGSPVESNWVYGGIFQGLNRSVIYGYDPIEKYVVYSDTVGQFTGLTDKNGMKIFEGDIVAQNWYDHDEPADDSFGEVVFCEYDCSFSVMDVNKDGIVPLGECHAYHWEAEIIGNIHDNPELLEASHV